MRTKAFLLTVSAATWLVVACEKAASTPTPEGASGASGSAGSSGSGTGGSGGSGGGSVGGGASASGGTAGVLQDAGSDAPIEADDGGSSGGAGGSAEEGCSAHDYLICEDFESTDPGDVPVGWTRHGDESGVVDDVARHGSKSLELGAIPEWERRIYHDASMLGSSHWGRIYYRVQLPVPNAFVHSTLVAFSGVGPTIGEAEFRVVDTVKQAFDTPDVASKHNFLFNVQPKNSGEFGTETSYDWMFDGEWHCAEWFVDASVQAYRFYLDGTEELSFEHGAGNYDDSELPDSFDEIKVGWINYQNSPPGFTAYIDDIAVDDERIGCGD